MKMSAKKRTPVHSTSNNTNLPQKRLLFKRETQPSAPSGSIPSRDATLKPPEIACVYSRKGINSYFLTHMSKKNLF